MQREGASPSLQSELGCGTRPLFSECYQIFPWAAGTNSALAAHVQHPHTALGNVFKNVSMPVTFRIHPQAAGAVLSHYRGRSSREAKGQSAFLFLKFFFFLNQLGLSYSEWHRVNIWRGFLHSTHWNFGDILLHLLPQKRKDTCSLYKMSSPSYKNLNSQHCHTLRK